MDTIACATTRPLKIPRDFHRTRARRAAPPQQRVTWCRPIPCLAAAASFCSTVGDSGSSASSAIGRPCVPAATQLLAPRYVVVPQAPQVGAQVRDIGLEPLYLRLALQAAGTRPRVALGGHGSPLPAQRQGEHGRADLVGRGAQGVVDQMRVPRRRRRRACPSSAPMSGRLARPASRLHANGADHGPADRRSRPRAAPPTTPP